MLAQPGRPPFGSILAAILTALVVAVLATWPTVQSLGTAVPGRWLDGDVALNLWSLSWIYDHPDSRAILDANIFHPEQGALALTDLLWGQALLGLPGHALSGTVAAYGLAFFLSSFLTALCMGLLVYRLTGERLGPLFAAATFATLPYLATHTNHLQLQFAGCFPLLLLALFAYADRPGLRRAVGVGLAVAIGALFSAYYAVFLALTAAVAGLALALSRSELRSKRSLAGALVATIIAAVVAAPAVWPHIQGGHARSVHQIARTSADLGDYLSWTAPDPIPSWEERTIAIPTIALLLALVGLVATWRDRQRRVVALALTALGGIGLVLSLGTDGLIGEAYATLMRLPGFSGIRAPARWSILVATAVVALAGVGLAELRRRLPSRVGVGIAFAALALVGLENGVPGNRVVAVPAPGPSEIFLASAPRQGAVIHLPAATVSAERNTRYMLGSRAHFRRLVNGYSGETPRMYGTIVQTLAELPTERSLRLAHDLGVVYVVVHDDDETVEGDRLELAHESARQVFEAAGVRVYELSESDATAPSDTPPVIDGPPAQLAAIPFVPGEEISYDVVWSRLHAGTIRIAVRPGPEPGTLRLVVVAETDPKIRALYEARFDIEAVVDASTLLPITVTRTTREGARTQTDEARFDHDLGIIEANGLALGLEPAAHDPVTAFFALRAVDYPSPGETVSLELNDFGKPLMLNLTRRESDDGATVLTVVSREKGVTRREMTFEVRLDSSPTRPVGRLVVQTPIGAVEMLKTP